MTEVSGVVVAHGDLAAALIEAAERISGIEGALTAISNVGLSPDALAEPGFVQVLGKVRRSCLPTWQAEAVPSPADPSFRTRPALVVVTGTNLAMLIDFLFNRTSACAGADPPVVEKGSGRSTVSVPSWRA